MEAKESQGRPKGGQGEAKGDQREAKERPIEAKGRPRMPKGRRRRGQGEAKGGQGRPGQARRPTPKKICFLELVLAPFLEAPGLKKPAQVRKAIS